MKRYIGLDLGTSALKALLILENDEVLAEASVPYPVSYPHPGYCEQDPSAWVEALQRAIKSLLEASPGEVDGIAIDGQMHGLVLLDQNNEVLRPCILWNDSRAEKEARELNEHFSPQGMLERVGNLAFAGFSAPKLLWVKEHEPEIFARIAKVLLPKDYLAFYLTGLFSSDYSDASGTLFLDVAHKAYHQDLLSYCGIEESKLPPLFESYQTVGLVKKEFGLGERCFLRAGAGDNAAGAISTSTLLPGQCNLSLGTSGTLFLPSAHFVLDRSGGLHSFCDASGHYHLLSCILSAASARKWWLEEVLGSFDYQGDEDALKDCRTEMIFLPYLNGERSPINDPSSSGAFLNLRPTCKKEDFSLAVLEGVAFAFKHCLEAANQDGVEVTSSTICGGGARSDLWCQILSDVLELPLSRLKDNLGPAFGAALLAKGEAPMAREIEIEKTFLPRKRDDLKAKYVRYKEAYLALKGWY